MANITTSDDFAGTSAEPATRPSLSFRPDRIVSIASNVLPPVLFVVALIAGWAILSANGTFPSYILPSPGAVAHEFATNSHVLLKHVAATSLEAVSGFLIGNLSAIAMASLLTCSPFLKDMFFPYALISRAIPIIVFTPVFVVLLGRGLPPILAIVSISVYFPTFLNMMRGLNSVDLDYQELLHTLSADRLQRLRLIQFPASMPYLFAALKVSASASFISALVTEWIGANTGIGYLITVSAQYNKPPTMWAAIFSAALLTLVLLGLVALLERVLRRWTGSAEELSR